MQACKHCPREAAARRVPAGAGWPAPQATPGSSTPPPAPTHRRRRRGPLCSPCTCIGRGQVEGRGREEGQVRAGPARLGPEGPGEVGGRPRRNGRARACVPAAGRPPAPRCERAPRPHSQLHRFTETETSHGGALTRGSTRAHSRAQSRSASPQNPGRGAASAASRSGSGAAAGCGGPGLHQGVFVGAAEGRRR